MRQIVVPIMAIVAFLLGLYMIIVSFKNSDYAAQYHVGCYLSDEHRLYYSQISSKLDILKQQDEINRIFFGLQNKQTKAVQIIDKHLKDKSVKLSKNVQKYIQKLVLKKRYQQNNMNFFVQLQKAQDNLKNCAVSIKNNFHPDDCKQLWASYQACFDDYSRQKRDLKDLISDRDAVLQKLIVLVNEGPSKQNNQQMQRAIMRIRQKYYGLNRQNDENRKAATQQLKILSRQNDTLYQTYRESQIQYSSSKTNYQICKRNLKQFRKCEQISKALDDYGNAQSFENIQQKLTIKRQRLRQIESLIKKSDMTSSNRNMKDLKAKIMSEVKQLMALLITISIDEKKQCGCSVQKMGEFESQYHVLNRQLEKIKQDINVNNIKIYDLHKSIRLFDKQGVRLLQAEQDQINKLTGKISPDQTDIHIAVLLQNQLKDKNGLILSYSKNINSAQFKCNQISDQLSNKLNYLDQIVNCVGIKDFYQQLSSKAEQILYGSDPLTQKHRDQILSILRSIQYPRAIAPMNNRQIKIIQQVMELKQQSARNKAQAALESDIAHAQNIKRAKYARQQQLQETINHQRELAQQPHHEKKIIHEDIHIQIHRDIQVVDQL